MGKYLCQTCGFIYDEEQGDSKNGVPPQTKLSDLKNSLCSQCGLKNLTTYQLITNAYQGLEAELYHYFCGKWDSNFYLKQTQQFKNSTKKVLDIGTGTGRVTKELLTTGAQVFSLERSPSMLKQLKKQIWTKNKQLTILETNFITYQDTQTYDALIFSDGILQEMACENDLKSLFNHMNKLVKKGGFIWLELILPQKNKIYYSRTKQLNLQQLLSLTVKMNKISEYFSEYTSTFELFEQGHSTRHYQVNREFKRLTLDTITKNLPQNLTLEKMSNLPQDFRQKNQITNQYTWTDGGYPLPNSHKDIQKIMLLLKKN